ncbi:hypothetical protein [Shinella zoogloeoides]|uniref:hypothetical protein n=1 Tax=Shinella zoogloeoides TaxID=352475 RepID=UPI00299EE511|nr:hypothetical protein [Shinella zoogloeoides]WPE22504.1 hypothetical protein ShzoTeo12_37200 [Shinella zoogloeoides]
MREHDSKRAPSLAIHPSIVKAALSATNEMAEAQAAANYLAETMQRIHGGMWRVKINHVNECVTVSRRIGSGRVSPKPEVA